jgi:hypothetical protein
MRIFGAITLTLAIELLLGAAIFAAGAWVLRSLRSGRFATRRRRVNWIEASRALVPAVPLAAVLLAVSIASILAPGDGAPRAVRIWPTPAPFALAGAVATAGCWLILHAGHREARGMLRAARRQARFGGSAMFLGILAQLVVAWSDLLFSVPFRRAVLGTTTPALSLAVAMLALGVAAFIGLVAGMAGKPRPSGHFAALFYLAGVAGLAVAALW